MTTTPWWINLIAIAIAIISTLVAYRQGCKHGYARGHEDGRKAGATEMANMLNGMREKATTGECVAEEGSLCVYEDFGPHGERTRQCKYCGRPE